MQDNATTRMSQIGLNYRESSLSETHAHPGDLMAGDRVPDFDVKVLPAPGDAGDVDGLAAYLKKWMTADDAPTAGGDTGGEHYEKPQQH